MSAECCPRFPTLAATAAGPTYATLLAGVAGEAQRCGDHGVPSGVESTDGGSAAAEVSGDAEARHEAGAGDEGNAAVGTAARVGAWPNGAWMLLQLLPLKSARAEGVLLTP